LFYPTLAFLYNLRPNLLKQEQHGLTSRHHLGVNWQADTRSLHRTIDSIRATNPAAMPSIAGDWLNCALAERDPLPQKMP
jgi:hypothetical protein